MTSKWLIIFVIQTPLPLHLSPVSTLLNVASGEVGDLQTENIQFTERHHCV